ncbi:MAG TPA: hydroxymethylglutaryl-CoA synthase [Haliangium sp.]|nr:hydroxymethylglutaryl-CoA synthase [Haliangium sp.]
MTMMTSTHPPRVGIDAMAFHGPEHYVDMADLARARGVDPAKYLQGLGQRQMAVPTPCEDTVSMAAAAGRRALAAFDIDPAEIGMLIVGTETGVDHSKPVAVYVHDLLGLPERCRTFETKHACYGAMAGLTSAVDWIAAGRARGRKALIIASDIARYGIGTVGEPTQGAGAVAMVVSAAPRLIALDTDVAGDYTRQVMDFWRPLYSKYAFADGHYSISCYLDALSGALSDARDKAASADVLALSSMRACFYHVPFVKMARKAHHRHWEAELGREIAPGGDAGDADPASAAIADSYETRVAPWLGLNAIVGNIYTGSLFLALIDYVRRLDPAGAPAEQPISMFSYGSGCGAAFCLGRVQAGAASLAARLDPRDTLARRRKLDVAAYEALLAACEAAEANDSAIASPETWQLEGDFLYVGTRDHVRRYRGAPR